MKTWAAFLLFSTVSPAFAVDIKLKLPSIETPDQPVVIEGENNDVAGLKTGISPDFVRHKMVSLNYKIEGEEWIKSEFASPMLIEGNRVLFENSDSLNYIRNHSFHKEEAHFSDTIQVHYASKLGGNKAVSILRKIIYRQGHEIPRDQLIASLTKKYGPPINSAISGYTDELCWFWSRRGREPGRPCDSKQSIQRIVASFDQGPVVRSLILRYDDIHLDNKTDKDDLTGTQKIINLIKAAIAQERAKSSTATPRL